MLTKKNARKTVQGLKAPREKSNEKNSKKDNGHITNNTRNFSKIL